MTRQNWSGKRPFRKIIMEIVEDFIEESYTNKGKPWKSSKILRVNPKTLENFEYFELCDFSSFFIFVFPFLFFFFLFFLLVLFLSLCSLLFFFCFPLFILYCFCFPFCFFHLLFLFLFLFFFFHSSKQTPKPAKNRRTIPVVKMTRPFCENLIFGPRWTRGLGVAHMRVTSLS